MATPATRTPVRIARGSYSNLNSSISDLQDGEIVYAEDQDKLYVKEGSSLVVLTQPPASPTFTGDVTINAQGDLRFADSDSSNYVGFQSPATVSSNIVWTLPSTDGGANQYLKTDGSGALSWGSDSATDSTKLPLAGGTMSGDINLGSNDITNGGTITGTFSGNLTGNVTGNASGSAGSCTGTAAIATAITIADESSDTTCFPLFATAATGDLGAKSGSNLTFNSSSGALTATSFVGALTGDVTGNASGSSGSCTGNAASATYASAVTVADESSDTSCFPLFASAATGNLDVYSGSNLTFNSSSGLLTASGFSGDGSSITDINASNITSGTLAAGRVATLNQNTTGTAATVTGAAQAAITSVGTLTTLEVTGDLDIGDEIAHIGDTNTKIRFPSNDTVTIETAGTEGFRLNSSQNATFAGTVSDSKGDLRTIVQTSKSSAHTIVAADSGKHSINSSGGWTLNTSTGFTAGQAITLINNSGSDQTITATGVTLYNTADAATGNRTLAGRGMATVICTASNTYYVSGAGLS